MIDVFDKQQVADNLPYARLIKSLEETFRNPPVSPPRSHFDIDSANPGRMTLLSMPAWEADGFIGTKLVTVAPENPQKGLATVDGFYLTMDSGSGRPLALLDAPELTARRTAGVSALASSYLSRADASTLLVVGTGTLAPHMVWAHAAVRPITRVLIWGRSFQKAEAVAEQVRESGLAADAAPSLETAVGDADIISCVTTSRAPIVFGSWLQDGAHLDLVGAFKADRRESDDEAVKRGRLFADTRAGVMAEGGDFLIPMSRGVISEKAVEADLFDLAARRHEGRASRSEITVFKSVGASLEDFAAAKCILNRTEA